MAGKLGPAPNKCAHQRHVASALCATPTAHAPCLIAEEEPPAVRMNDMLGGILTYKLRGKRGRRAATGGPGSVAEGVGLRRLCL